jgi:hypothetical protein
MSEEPRRGDKSLATILRPAQRKLRLGRADLIPAVEHVGGHDGAMLGENKGKIFAMSGATGAPAQERKVLTRRFSPALTCLQPTMQRGRRALGCLRNLALAESHAPQDERK